VAEDGLQAASMVEAQRLYEAFGFRDISAYCSNPIAETRYLRKSLLVA
jgi:hypothetical protein